MSVVKHTGTISAGNQCGSTVAGALFTATIGFTASYENANGVLQRQVTSPSAYVELASIGTGNDVPKASVFYFQSTSEFLVRITQDDGVGGSTVIVVPVQGELMMQVPAAKSITKVEIQGTGKVTYFASGS